MGWYSVGVTRHDANGHHIVRLEFTSAFEMLDFVQVVSDHMARDVGLDDDALHWVGVAIRESVINAIKHGNRNDAAQARLRRVRDRDRGRRRRADDPRARSGRGLRSRDGRRPARSREPAEGERPRHLPHPQLHGRRPAAARAGRRHGNPHGQARAASRRLDVRTPECRDPAASSPPPSKRSSRRRPADGAASAATSAIDKKGTIDLVTEVDLAVERMFRALIAERFPDHQVLAEELGGSAERAARARAGCSIRSTARPTSRTACRSSARRWRSKSTASPRSPPSTIRTRKELFTAERGGGAFLNGAPLRVSPAAHARRRDARHRLSVRRARARRRDRRAVRRRSSARRARCGGWDRRRSTSATSRPAGWTASGRATSKPWDIAGGALIVAEAGGRVTGIDGGAVQLARRPRPRDQRPPARRHARRDRGRSASRSCSAADEVIPARDSRRRNPGDFGADFRRKLLASLLL